ncbi:MAG: phosphoribosylglycinamide formyltransferase [Gaiellaceae bacterium]
MIGVLVSGRGSNLQALIDQGLPLAAVASNVPGVAALARAEAAGIPTAVFSLEDFRSREDRDLALAGWLEEHAVDLAVCAGYMHLLTPPFLERFRAINVHPSLLPAFPGTTPIEDALAAGVPETGVTVHFVDEGVDSGPVIFQEPVAIKPGDTPETLRERVHEVEHRLLPEAVRLYLAGALRS